MQSLARTTLFLQVTLKGRRACAYLVQVGDFDVEFGDGGGVRLRLLFPLFLSLSLLLGLTQDHRDVLFLRYRRALKTQTP